MLHLKHNPLLGGINKYYNMVSRFVLPNIIPINQSSYSTNFKGPAPPLPTDDISKHAQVSIDSSYPIPLFDLDLVYRNPPIIVKTSNGAEIDTASNPHEIILYQSPPKEQHAKQHATEIKYLKYKLKYKLLLNKWVTSNPKELA
jgi:hypothetical protein